VPGILRSEAALVRWCGSRLGVADTKVLSVLWVDDVTALVVFPNAGAAQLARTYFIRSLRDSSAAGVKPMGPDADTRVFELATRVRERYESVHGTTLPGPSRPDTDPRVARRLITHALGGATAARRRGQVAAADAAPAGGQAMYLRSSEDWESGRAARMAAAAALTAGAGGGGAGSSAAPPPPPSAAVADARRGATPAAAAGSPAAAPAPAPAAAVASTTK